MPEEPSPTARDTDPGDASSDDAAGYDRRLRRQVPEAPPALTDAPARQPRSRQPRSREPASAGDLDPKAFKLPEGVQADEAVLGEFAGVAKELGINQEGAQRLVDLYAKQAKAEAVKPYEQWHAMQKQWQDEIKADPSIGGDKLEPALQKVAKVLDTYGDPEVRKALSFTGAGNNPAIIRTLVKMAEALSEGGPIVGAPPTGKPKTAAEAMYPHLKAG
jgi:hypothetical protein